MIQGVGIDIVEIYRIDGAIRKWGQHFLNRVFSVPEIDYCSRKQFSARHYAARFAAKEACLKSMGIGLGGGLALRDIVIMNDPSQKPELMIDIDLSPILRNPESYRFHLSMTHTSEYASAVVILEMTG